MTKWERFEEFLFTWDLAGHKSFRNEDVKEFFGITGREATDLIQAYLDAMINSNLNTLFTIIREDRTTAAVWHVGHTVKHHRALTAQFANDVENRIVTAIAPIMEHIVKLNPKAQQQATKTAIKIGRLVQQLAELAK